MQSAIAKSDRKFTKPNSISQILKCPICLEVFYLPTRLFCGHTYCYDCISSSVKTKPTCPLCRVQVDSNNVGKDLLAFNIINELEVFCLYEQCSWKGQLELLELHLQNECLLNTESERKRHKNEAKREQFKFNKQPLDQEVQEKINENVNKGCLISRAIMRDDSLRTGSRFDIARKMLRTETEPFKNNKGKNIKKEQKDNGFDESNNLKQKQGERNNLDFLMELYE